MNQPRYVNVYVMQDGKQFIGNPWSSKSSSDIAKNFFAGKREVKFTYRIVCRPK